MATPASQRIGIWVITVVMLVGVIGSFAVMILSNQNNQQTASDQQKALDAYNKQLAEQQKQAKVLSEQYYPTFSQYKNTPASFDPTTVGSTVTTRDLVVGTGADITDKSTYQAYYIGWNPDGKTFDSSFDTGDTLKAPLDATPNGLIKGWTQGVVGMKVGGIREITIPAQLAYGDQSPSADIPANTPLKFIIYIVKTK